MDELRYMLCNNEPAIDMIGICETLLNETYLDSEVAVPNYNMFRRG